MKKAPIIGIFAILLVGLISSTAFAMPFGEDKNLEENELKTALLNSDYEAYLEAFEESDRPFFIHQMSEEQFLKKAQNFQSMQENKESISNAMDEGYDEWVIVIEEITNSEETPEKMQEKILEITDIITEENFDTFIAMHDAMEEKDFETVKELSEELGLERPHHRMGKMNFMKGDCSHKAME